MEMGVDSLKQRVTAGLVESSTADWSRHAAVDPWLAAVPVVTDSVEVIRLESWFIRCSRIVVGTAVGTGASAG